MPRLRRSAAEWRQHVQDLYASPSARAEWILEGFFHRMLVGDDAWQELRQYRWPKSIRQALHCWARSIDWDEGSIHRWRIRYRLRHATKRRFIPLPSVAQLDDVASTKAFVFPPKPQPLFGRRRRPSRARGKGD